MDRGSKVAAAKPVSQWVLAGDPIAMIEVMWNHAANMRDEMARQKIKWPKLTGQDISDVLVYVRGLPAASKTRVFSRPLPTPMRRLCSWKRAVCLP